MIVINTSDELYIKIRDSFADLKLSTPSYMVTNRFEKWLKKSGGRIEFYDESQDECLTAHACCGITGLLLNKDKIIFDHEKNLTILYLMMSK